MKGDDYLNHFMLRNFHFHVTAAYASLRHYGVDIGKSDYCGAIPMKTTRGKVRRRSPFTATPFTSDRPHPGGPVCGRRPGKNFLTFLQHWSGAVTCPAC